MKLYISGIFKLKRSRCILVYCPPIIWETIQSLKVPINVNKANSLYSIPAAFNVLQWCWDSVTKWCKSFLAHAILCWFFIDDEFTDGILLLYLCIGIFRPAGPQFRNEIQYFEGSFDGLSDISWIRNLVLAHILVSTITILIFGQQRQLMVKAWSLWLHQTAKEIFDCQLITLAALKHTFCIDYFISRDLNQINLTYIIRDIIHSSTWHFPYDLCRQVLKCYSMRPIFTMNLK